MKGNAEALADALDRITDGILVYDPEWRIAYLNRSAERYFDRSREELVGRRFGEAFPTAVGTHTEARLREAAASPAPSEFELFTPVRRRWVAFRAYPSEAGLTVYFRDVTEQKVAQDTLRESEARYRALFEHSLNATLLTAPSGDILAANPAACRMFEMTEQEIRAGGRSLLVDLSDPRGAAFLDARRRDGHAHGEVTCLRKGRRPFPAEVSSAIFRDATGAERTSMLIHDLSIRRRAQAAVALLADAGKRLGASLDPEGTLRSLTGLLVPRFADACLVDVIAGGVVRRTLLASRAAELRSLEVDATSWREAFGRVLASRSGERMPSPDASWLRAASLDPSALGGGHDKPCRLLALPLVARDRVIGVLVLARCPEREDFDAADVTLGEGIADRAAMAIENAGLYAAALEARRVRDEVLGIVSHDLRNPLNGIALTAQVLGRRKPEDPEPRIIMRAVAVANQLINDLLLAAKLESGTLALNPRPESVRAILDEVVVLAGPAAEERSIALDVSVEGGVDEANLDRQRVRQLLGNLVSNALKFTPVDGRVAVRARRAGDHLELSVADTGPGVRPEQRAHLFDRFWQGAHAHRADAGLGLSIAKGIAEAHGGSIRVESEPGRGATFIVALPMS